jgi:uncharacterized protein YndB with AHSA1/START domain
MTTKAEPTTTQVYRIYIKATPEAIWEAITKPEWTEKYLYEARVEFDLRPGGAYRAYPSDMMRVHGAEMGYPIPDIVVDGEVIEADPPRRLVQTWRMLMDPTMAAEGSPASRGRSRSSRAASASSRWSTTWRAPRRSRRSSAAGWRTRAPAAAGRRPSAA